MNRPDTIIVEPHEDDDFVEYIIDNRRRSDTIRYRDVDWRGVALDLLPDLKTMIKQTGATMPPGLKVRGFAPEFIDDAAKCIRSLSSWYGIRYPLLAPFRDIIVGGMFNSLYSW
jgi:hypothetical protein